MSKNPRDQLPEPYSETSRSGLFPSLLPRFFLNPWSSLFDEDFLPSSLQTQGVRVYEKDNELHVEAPLPGLKPEEIEVKLNNGILFINGRCQEEEKDNRKKFYRSSTRQYSYSIALPAQIDEKQERQAVYQDGILNISFPLEKKTTEGKKITVKTGTNKK